MDRIFELSGLTVLPFWLLMIGAPRAGLTRRLMGTLAAPGVAALLYAVLVLPRVPELLPLLARPELGPITALLGTPTGATIAWVHFLSFDLFVGRWLYLDAGERGLPFWFVSPLLALTLLFGPLGLLSYVTLRGLFTGRETPAVSGGVL